MGRKAPYSEAELRQAVSTSISYAQVLRKLGRVPAGGNYAVLKNALKQYDINIDHFKGQAHSKGKKLGPRRSLSELLQPNSRVQSYKLKRRLFKEGIFEKVCMRCRQTAWLDEPIPLELHHIDGNSHNNTLENLKILCPNCHALTKNYRGKNKGMHD